MYLRACIIAIAISSLSVVVLHDGLPLPISIALQVARRCLTWFRLWWANLLMIRSFTSSVPASKMSTSSQPLAISSMPLEPSVPRFVSFTNDHSLCNVPLLHRNQTIFFIRNYLLCGFKDIRKVVMGLALTNTRLLQQKLYVPSLVLIHY